MFTLLSRPSPSARVLAFCSASLLPVALALAGCGGGGTAPVTPPPVATPTFSPASGTFTSTQSVTLSDATAGATIYYTTDGTTPTTASTAYTTAISVAKTTTINAIAAAAGDNTSAEASATFTIGVATPTFSPAAGTFTTPQSVFIADATSGATIYYTTDGSIPTTSSTVYTSAIPVAATTTINAIAAVAGESNSALATAVYTIAVATPTFSPAGGTYTAVQSVSIGDTTSGATIYYTLDGSTPTTASTQYNGAITVGATTTINAIATASGLANSTVATATYTINLPAAATPTFSPAAGTFTSTQSVTIADTTPGATIYYTTNGTTPTLSSPVYGGAISVGSTTTIEAIAVATGYSTSALATGVFTINLPPAATPTFSPVAGTFTSAQTVSIGDTSAGATIYYTTDGSTPTTSSAKFTSAISVTTTTTIKAIATASGFSTSAVASGTFTINLPPAATPMFSPVAGTYTSAQMVTISDTSAGATIYYTTDGSMPTTASTKFTSPISVSSTETINAIATANGFNTSAEASALFTINLPAAATPTFSPAAGTYTSVQTVTISDTTAGATIYYTTDGSMPTTSSTKFTTAITVSSTETINAIATASGYNTSAEATGLFTINLPAAATPTFSPVAGTYVTTQPVTISDTTSGATIYYTTDGSMPTTASTKYSNAISVATTTTINAIATASGYGTSPHRHRNLHDIESDDDGEHLPDHAR